MIQRTFICGSEWLYYKLYSGPKTLENILVHDILPMLDLLNSEGCIDTYFFIRYADPEYHIRLRIHLKDISHLAKVIECLRKALEGYIQNNIISRIVVDTYKRELERYRPHYIQDIEQLFFYDTQFILRYLSREEREANKWLVCIKYIDLLLNKCGFNLDDKINYTSQISTSFAEEIYSNTTFTRKQINQKYRDNMKIIKEVMSECVSEYSLWIPELKNYINNISNFACKIKNEELKEKHDILSSIIHMHINRLFRTKQRIDECVIYHFLNKYYESEKAYRINKKRII